MTAKPPADNKRLSAALTRVLALLALSAFINFVDRGNLSVAAPLLKDELGFSASQLGILLSSFFWTYTLFQIITGWLVDRFDVNWAIALGFFLWSAATAITGVVHGFAALLVARLILGLGAAVAIPSYSKILARHFPEHHRGFANSVISAGVACGPAFGTLAGGMLMARFGWRLFFVAFGLSSLAWLIPWCLWMPRGQLRAASEARRAAPGIVEILKQRSAWGTFAGLFCGLYLMYFLLVWLPFYLVRERHFSMDAMAQIGSGIFLSMAVFATVAGWVSDRLIAAGGSPTLVRKTFVAGGLTCAGGFLGASVLCGPAPFVILLLMTGASFGVCTSNILAITQTLAGAQAAGRWTGLQSASGNLAGVLTSALTGLIVDRSGHFFWAFAITAIISLIGSISFACLVGPVEPVAWKPRRPTHPAAVFVDPA